MSDQFIGQVLADKYRVDSLLREEDGDGSLGKFYRATHLLMDKPAILKILAPALAVDDEIVKRFSVEAKTVSRIASQNVLNVTDFGTDKSGAAYIVFEGADESEVLKDAIRREGRLEQTRAVRIARQIARALASAHAAQTIHGSLNPENVLLAKAASGSETVKVLDFGAASPDDFGDGETYQKKLEYRAPELNSSVADADERSDIYALGVAFYEMLAGETPYAADTPTALLMKQAQNPPPPLSAFRSDLNGGIESAILRALAKNPEMRYQSADEFLADLNRAASDAGEAETVVVPNANLPENVKNNLWKTAFVVLAGISLLAVGLIYSMNRNNRTDLPTAMQTDANGQPVQPLNPATGMNELGAANMMSYSPEMLANSNMMLTMPQTVPQPNGDGYGDGYNPWARGVPPPGAPVYPGQPGGQMIDPNNPNSIFMQDGTVLVPVAPTNANVSANAKPAASPTVKPNANAGANTAPQPTPAPTANPQASPPKPANTPAAKPIETPKKNPAATERQAKSGNEQDS